MESELLNEIMKWADENDISELDINNSGIPRNEIELLNLEEIDLLGYDLKDLPSEIGILTNLKILNVNYCDLESIPSEISNLYNLEHLELGATCSKIVELPKSIVKLKNLKSLALNGNFSNNSFELLTELPLEYLQITHNSSLTSLPIDFFKKLKYLKHIELAQVNNLQLSNIEYEYALSLRKISYQHYQRRKIDFGSGFCYFSYSGIPNT